MEFGEICKILWNLSRALDRPLPVPHLAQKLARSQIRCVHITYKIFAVGAFLVLVLSIISGFCKFHQNPIRAMMRLGEISEIWWNLQILVKFVTCTRRATPGVPPDSKIGLKPDTMRSHNIWNMCRWGSPNFDFIIRFWDFANFTKIRSVLCWD